MRALDLFAGTGWGVACQALGIEEFGVDNAPSVIATREANGMQTPFHDVWDGLEGRVEVPEHDILIGSPPCQTFSLAGSGNGRRALDDVLRLVAEEAHLRVHDLRSFAAEHGDERTALVLAPLAYAARYLPTFVVLEQVPPVLPVWDACAEALRDLGYSAWSGILHAEQYGVPQARKRAVLIARRDGMPASPPAPTHSRFYARTPDRFDSGVLPWVCAAKALGWDELDAGSASWVHRRPSTSVAADDRIAGPGRSEFVKGGVSRQNRPGTIRVTTAEAAALQSYPEGFQWVGSRAQAFRQIGNAVPPLLAQAILEWATA